MNRCYVKMNDTRSSEEKKLCEIFSLFPIIIINYIEISQIMPAFVSFEGKTSEFFFIKMFSYNKSRFNRNGTREGESSIYD